MQYTRLCSRILPLTQLKKQNDTNDTMHHHDQIKEQLQQQRRKDSGAQQGERPRDDRGTINRDQKKASSYESVQQEQREQQKLQQQVLFHTHNWQKEKEKTQNQIKLALAKEQERLNLDKETRDERRKEEDGFRVVLDEDKGTPDEWIKRHPKLIRLTGKHPFNAEPPTTDLMNHGFFTPSSLHYVRNHGSVPRLNWDTHKIIVDGLVDHPCEFSMEELTTKFQSIEIPVTITCDGNRRKELNMIKHSRGFDWGCGAVSTSVWKGVRLADVLASCGVNVDDMEGKYACFEGSDKLAKGSYGTSVPLPIACDPTHDVILAYEMNGERLPPDHGFPVRVVLPGMVGGRMVKWLKRITVSAEESPSYYHWHDNKVLPSSVDFSTVDTGGWWYKSEFTLYDLNINSAITTPSHGERIQVGPNIKEEDEFIVKGYAYSGGGRIITRVDVSLNEGREWYSCNVRYPEKITRHGLRVWTWCHWDVSFPIWKLIQADSIVVRAWDRSCNTQPQHPTWNLLGMMNNCWYKVNIEVDEVEEERKYLEIMFRHPTNPEQTFAGWKEKPQKPTSFSKEYKSFTWEEIRQHNKENDCWIVVDGDVYDVSSYMNDHPGGATPILLYGGQDVSAVFKQIHGSDAVEIRNWFCIGSVLQIPERKPQTQQGSLNPRRWIDMKLAKKHDLSHDTRRFIFEFKDRNKPVGIDVGHHILLGADIDGTFVVRPYTPVKPVDEKEDNGLIELVIKIYGAGKNQKKGGVMTSFLDTLQIGDNLKVKGPAGHMLYRGRGVLSIHSTTIKVRFISMVAGGTGITPMFQLAKAILRDRKDNTKISLLYANHTEEDILLRKELDEMASKHKNQFQVWFTVSTPPEKWTYGVGRLNDHMMREHLFAPGQDSIALLCGPPAMVENAGIPNLERIGFTEDNMFEF